MAIKPDAFPDRNIGGSDDYNPSNVEPNNVKNIIQEKGGGKSMPILGDQGSTNNPTVDSKFWRNFGIDAPSK
jgi:hypothetical protein